MSQNLSGEHWGKTTELICKCQFNKRQWNIIPFEKGKFCKKKKPAATPPVGKVHSFSKIVVTCEPIQQYICPSRFKISEKNEYRLFHEWKHHF